MSTLKGQQTELTKKLEEWSDGELAATHHVVERRINALQDALDEVDPEKLTPEEQAHHNKLLEEAYELESLLGSEGIRRLVAQLQKAADLPQNSNPDHQARNLYVACSTYRDAATLVDLLEQVLRDAQIPATVLKYGTTNKSHNGFVAMEYYRPLPGDLLDLLHTEPAIIDYVIYDAPSLDQERQAEQVILQQQASAIYSKAEVESSRKPPAVPPVPPDEYHLLSVPTPLLAEFDERWIARATGPEGLGYLIYEHLRIRLFLPIDEALIAVAKMSQESRSWIEYAHPVSEQHRQLIAELRVHWHMLARESAQDHEGGPQG